jgi:hypothetical protein
VSAVVWGVSILDFRAHAVEDQYALRHRLVYTAVCGHLLMMGTPLHETPPGKTCEVCAEHQVNLAMLNRHDE